MARDHDHLCFRGCLFGRCEDVEPADVVHHQVGHHDIEDLVGDPFGTFPATASDHATVAEPLQHLCHRAGVREVVVDHQNAHKRRRWLRG